MIAVHELKIPFQGTASLDTNSALIVAADPRRRYVEITNSSDVGVWLALGGPAVIGEGIYLGPAGFSYEININNLWRGTIYAIAASGSGKVVGIQGLR